jgi:uncharacterized membrane protein (UPF0182 family)
MLRRNWLWVLVGVALAVGIGATSIAVFYTDILWFGEVGFLSVFTTVLSARAVTGLLGALFFFLITFVSLQAVLWKRRNLTLVGGLVMPVPISVTVPDRIRKWMLLPSAVVGILGGVAAFSQWHVVLAYLNRTPFGLSDPFFGKDVGFYIFTLPFYRLLQQHLWVAFTAALAVSALAYFIFGDIRFAPRRIAVEKRARAHLSILATILFVLRAWGYQISVWDLMYSPRGVAFGASYVDVNAQVPAFRVLIFAALLGAALSLASLALRSMRFIGYSVAILVILSLGVGYAYPAFMQNFTVSPNELAYELPFIEHNIRFTRQAFGIDDIESVPFAAANNITQAELQENSATIRNFRLWDYRVLKDTYTQVQEIRMYYKFNDVDVDRYVVNGELRLALSSARELDISALPPEANSWINIHLKYTHGYGIVMSPASEVTRDGMPAFYLQDIPPKPSADVSVTRPEIYFGELTNHYIIVNTKEPEFDYPRTETETLEPTFYQGKAGIPLGGFLRRLAFMLRFRDYQILVSGAVTPESRVVMRRNIMERVRAIAPFLMYDQDPYIVTADGKLYWMLDAYTVSANYPYSQPDPVAGVNYIRNSVKVVIDAYDGTITFYQADLEDPIIMTYAKIFPELLTPISEMPESLKAHIRYPEDMFKIQSRTLLTYHMTDPNVYYNKEDYWELPREVYGASETAVTPYYIVLDVPGQDEPEYMLMTAFTPRGKPNMTAWLGIRCDYNEYGKATLYAVPKDMLVPGPMQVESLFSQNPQIAANMTLWGQRGSQVIRGNLLTYPVGDSLLYMEPLYLQAETVRIPELKLVLMYYGGRVVMGTSVADALSQLFGEGLPIEPPDGTQPGERPTDVTGLVAEANALWREAQEALRAGDWAGYGRAIEELGRVLSELSGLTGAAAVELEGALPEEPVGTVP